VAEFDELRIVVRVTDEASGQLGALKRTFDELGGVELSKKMEGVNKVFAETEKNFKELLKHFATGGPSLQGLAQFARGFAPIGLAIAAVYETIKGTLETVKRQAQGILNMAAMASRVGQSTAQYQRTMEVFARSQVPIERAGEQWERFNDIWNEMRRGSREGRAAHDELLKDLRGEDAKEAERRFQQIINAPSPEEGANLLRQWFADVRAHYARMGDPAKGAREGRKLLQIYGLPDLDRVKEAFTIVSDQEVEDMKRMVAAAEEFNRVSVQIGINWDHITQAMGVMIMEGPLGPVLKLIERATKSEAGRMEGSTAPWWFEALGFTPVGMATKFVAPDFWNMLGRGAGQVQWPQSGAELAPGAPGNLAVPLMSTDTDGKHLDLQDELIDQLKRFNNLLSGDEKSGESLGLEAQLGATELSTGKTQSPAGFVNNDLSESAFTRLMRGGVFEGKYQTVVNTAHAQGMSPSLMASILAFETGYGKSRAVREYNNPAGLMAGGKGNREFMKFDTIESGIEKAGEVQKRIYTRGGETIAGMGAIYAPTKPGGGAVANDPYGTNKQWPGTVGRLQAQMKGGGFAARAREEHLAAAMNEQPVGLMTTEGTARMPEVVRRARARDIAQRAPEAQRFTDEGAWAQTPPYEAISAGVSAERFAQAIEGGPASTNVEDRRRTRRGLIGLSPMSMSDFDMPSISRSRRPITARGQPDLSTQLGSRDIPSEGRPSLDRGLAAESDIEPRGNLNVRVNAPAGTEVKATGEGMFEGNTSLDRQMQLPTLQ
jgi:hypothetical protein